MNKYRVKYAKLLLDKGKYTPEELVKLGDIAFVVVYQVLGVKDAVFVQQVFIVAFKVMIDDIRQVGSIRAGCNKRILR